MSTDQDRALEAELGRDASYDVFISYAGEDRGVAAELAHALRGMGFQVWYDKFELRPGDQILARINDGLRNSIYGILIISPAFLDKPWPKYETDVLTRNHIEGQTKLLPVWHGVTKEVVEQRQPGLAGVYALETTSGITSLARELARVMASAARTMCEIPSYMDPIYLFLRGRGELQTAADGRAFTIWEALIHFDDDDYPLWAGGRLFERDDLLVEVWQSLSNTEDKARLAVSRDGVQRIREMLAEKGLDPDIFG